MPHTAPLAAITGGTGFLGRYVIAAFRAAGWRVRLLVRRDPTHPQLPGLEAEIVAGGLTDPVALRRFSADADAVIHVAGAIKARNRADFFQVNETGSAALGKAVADAAPEARLVLLSSLAAREPQLSDYAASKRAGEAAFQDAAGRPAAILRPGAIHGPWDTETLVLFTLASRPFMPVPALPDARLSFVFASDVAQAALELARAETATSGVFELSDSQPAGYAWIDLAHAAARALGRTPRFVGVPSVVWPVAGFTTELIAKLTGGIPMMSRGKTREMLHPDWSCDPGRLPPQHIWRPTVDLETGFRQTVAWARQAGHLQESRTVK